MCADITRGINRTKAKHQSSVWQWQWHDCQWHARVRRVHICRYLQYIYSALHSRLAGCEV
jgi:hypothetical protein